MNTSRNIETKYEQREFNLPGTSSYQNEAKREIRRDQDNYMPTGIYVKPNEQVTIEISGSQNIRAIIGTYQYEISGGKQFKLFPGSNTISSPNGGVLWFDNYQDTGTVKVKVTQGGNFVPFFELEKHTKADWIMMLDKYSEAPAVQLKSKKAVLIVSRDSAKKYIVNQDPIPLLKKYDEMIQAQDKISGLSETDANPLHRSTRRLWTFIENTYNPNWGMYASRDGAVFTTAGEAIKSTLDENDFGWGQFHEAGHARQQYPWIWNDLRGMTEVTVNVYSLAAQKQLFPNQPTRLEIEGDYDRAFAYLKQTNKEYKDIDDLWVKLVMLWQLHLAYGEEFYPDLHKLYRELPEGWLPQTDEDKIQAFIYNTSKVAKQNLLPFFDQWGLNATPVTRKNVETLNFPILIDPIWEATDTKPVEVLKDGVYSIQTKMNQKFSIYNDNGRIKMDYALDYPERKFELTWDNAIKAYTCTQTGTNLALGIENGQIVATPFDKANRSQYWSIQKSGEHTYIIENFSQPSQCIDVEKAWAAPLPGGNVIAYTKNGNENQQWIFGKPIKIPTSQEVKEAFQVHAYEGHTVGAPSTPVTYRYGVYFKSPISPAILTAISNYEAIKVDKRGNETRTTVELTSKNGYDYLPINATSMEHQSYQLIAKLMNGKEVVILTGWRSYKTNFVDSEESLEQVESLEETSSIQFNFDHSTCNIFLNDNYNE